MIGVSELFEIKGDPTEPFEKYPCGVPTGQYIDNIIESKSASECLTNIALLDNVCKDAVSDPVLQYKVLGGFIGSDAGDGQCSASIFSMPTSDVALDGVGRYCEYTNPCCIQEGADPFDPNLCSNLRIQDSPSVALPCCSGFQGVQEVLKFVCQAPSPSL
jgi:hypothetical protein